MAADIRTAVDHAEHLIRALLILARNERGLTIREEVDLATVAEDVLDTARTGDRGIHATLEPAVISGDPLLAERLVANLVDNAVRYNTTAGDIWISTCTTAAATQLTVANTGPAISPADAERIFQPFQRLSDRTSHGGLGLAIVSSIAAIHDGTANARPRHDGGLVVTVTIPSASVAAQSQRNRHSDDRKNSCSTSLLTSPDASLTAGQRPALPARRSAQPRRDRRGDGPHRRRDATHGPAGRRHATARPPRPASLQGRGTGQLHHPADRVRGAGAVSRPRAELASADRDRRESYRRRGTAPPRHRKPAHERARAHPSRHHRHHRPDRRRRLRRH